MVTCLALNIYHEARGEGIIGMQAVALVTRNRARVTNKDICEVVYRPNQFSWTIYNSRVKDPKSFRLAQQVAIDVLEGRVSDITAGSTFFHTTSINPYWANKFIYRKTIGNHKFYFTLERPL